MLLDTLLAFSLLASTASQLRPTDANIGPGEAGLAIWLGLMLTRETLRLGPPLTAVLSRLLVFWIVFVVALCLGTMTEYALGAVHDPKWFWHDVFAYGVVAGVSCLIVVEPGAGTRMRRVAWLLATFGAGSLALQAAFGFGMISIGNIDPWEWDRLRGLSDNANQLALTCALISLLSLHLAEAAARLFGKIIAIICMVIAIVVGRLTKSDAFLLALVAAVPTFVVLKIRTWLLSRGTRLTLRSALAGIFVLILPFVLAYAIPLATSLASETHTTVMGMSRGGATGETEEAARLRLEIWSEAINRGIHAGMLGLGPGPHLPIPASIVAGRQTSANEPGHVEHPQVQFAPNFEAHNTFLDLFVQGGLIAVSAFVWLGAAALVTTWRARLDALTALLVGAAIFSGFHLIVRHPIVWFSITFCLVMAAEARKPSAASAGQ